MKQYIFYILSALSVLLFSCSKETEVLLTEDFDGPSVKQTGFVAGDVATRSSFEFDGSKLVFKWVKDDQIGIFATASKPASTRATTTEGDASEGSTSEGSTSEGGNTETSTDGLIAPTNDQSTRHPQLDDIGLWYTDPSKQNQAKYDCVEMKDGEQTARISSSSGVGFDWDENSRWSAYYHFKNTEEKYDEITFDFSVQKQVGFVNMTAYYGGNMATYRDSEHKACQHIADADVMISPETAYQSGRIRFEMRHVGAVARFFLVLPHDKAYKLTKLQLICETKIFHTQGKFSLKSRPYNSSAEDGDFGLTLVGANKTNSQIQPVGEATNNLELEFDPEKVIMDPSSFDGDCLIAYMMMYPVTYNQAQHGNLYAYVTAIDPTTGKEVHFVTAPLANKDMISGRYYQWTTFANPQDGLYPIELTATLLPWQNIVGGGIEVDMEK